MKTSASHSSRRLRRPLAALAALSLAAALTACSALGGSGSSGAGADGKVAVSTSFYPITYLVQAVGGEHVTVTSVTPPNAEPHDYELSPKDVTALGQASLIAYVPGFQPSLDEAVAQVSGPTVLDLGPAANLVHHEGVGEHHHDHGDHGEEDPQASQEPSAHAHDDDHSHEGEEGHGDHGDHGDHEDEAAPAQSATPSAQAHDEDSHEALDPHFWLDPERMTAAAQAVEAALSKADPDHAADYKANLDTVITSLGALDTNYGDGLKTCERTTVVTTHAAFGYLTERYGLAQASISGLDPESEPSPAELAAVKKVVQDTSTTTIFTEELVSPKTAEALAAETGATTAVLSPLESAPEKGDYIDAMTANLEALKTGLGCR